MENKKLSLTEKLMLTKQQKEKNEPLKKKVYEKLSPFIPQDIDPSILPFKPRSQCENRLNVEIEDDGKTVVVKYNSKEYRGTFKEDGTLSDKWTMTTGLKGVQDKEVVNVIFVEASFSEGLTYTGFATVNDVVIRQHGIGCTKYEQQSIYDNFIGEYNNGWPEGLGMLTYKNQKIYVGEFKNDKKHGLGYKAEELNNKGKYDILYDGEWADGKMNGEFVYLKRGTIKGNNGTQTHSRNMKVTCVLINGNIAHNKPIYISSALHEYTFNGKSIRRPDLIMSGKLSFSDGTYALGDFSLRGNGVMLPQGFITRVEGGKTVEGNFHKGKENGYVKSTCKTEGITQHAIYRLMDHAASRVEIEKTIKSSKVDPSDFTEVYYYIDSQQFYNHELSLQFNKDNYLIGIEAVLKLNHERRRTVFETQEEKPLDIECLVEFIIKASEGNPQAFPKEVIQEILNSLLCNGLLSKFNPQTTKHKLLFDVEKIKDKLDKKVIDNMQRYIEIKNDDISLANAFGFKAKSLGKLQNPVPQTTSKEFLHNSAFTVVTSFLKAQENYKVGLNSKAMLLGYLDYIARTYKTYQRTRENIKAFGNREKYLLHIHPALNFTQDFYEFYDKCPDVEKKYNALTNIIGKTEDDKKQEDVKIDNEEEIKESYKEGGENHHLLANVQQPLGLNSLNGAAKIDNQEEVKESDIPRSLNSSNGANNGDLGGKKEDDKQSVAIVELASEDKEKKQSIITELLPKNEEKKQSPKNSPKNSYQM